MISSSEHGQWSEEASKLFGKLDNLPEKVADISRLPYGIPAVVKITPPLPLSDGYKSLDGS